MEQTEKTLEQITAEIVNEAITCARQSDKWRKPYAALITPDGERYFVSSVGRFRTPAEIEDMQERAQLLANVTNLPPGSRVETRNMRYCSHKTERRDSWTRTETGWKHEEISGRNKHGY